jgi:hypothetical protein
MSSFNYLLGIPCPQRQDSSGLTWKAEHSSLQSRFRLLDVFTADQPLSANYCRLGTPKFDESEDGLALERSDTSLLYSIKDRPLRPRYYNFIIFSKKTCMSHTIDPYL